MGGWDYWESMPVPGVMSSVSSNSVIPLRASGRLPTASRAAAMSAVPDRRARRREQTREEILEHALQIMADDGVAGLTMAGLARATDIRPPSLYKYYPSLLAVYDALFRRGQLANLEALRDGMRDAQPGLDTVAGGTEATGRWAAANPVLAQLLFWRPVPGYQPSAEAFAPRAPDRRLAPRCPDGRRRPGPDPSRSRHRRRS